MNYKAALLPWAALLMVISVISLVPAAPQAVTAAEAAAPAVVYRTYLPIVHKAPSIIHGRVTEGGTPATGIGVSLRFFNGASWSTVSVANTDGTGRFQFLNAPALSGSQRYQVTFDNTTANDNRLAWWGTRHLTSFGPSASVHIGDFDIAAVHLTAPAHQATLPLPGAFHWTLRGASPTDSYAVRIYDTSDLNPLYVAPYVGYNASFTLNSLPGGFTPGTSYTWDVILLAPDGATGVSRAARSVRLATGIHGRVTQAGAAAGGVPLQLRFFNGTTWSTIASTTTGGDGSYVFSGAPTLGTGQKYYVRYQNVSQTAGRLFLWSTRSVTAYTAGAALDLGGFDIADVTLVNPPGGASISLPSAFEWTRRTATPSDSYILEIYDPSDYQPRWLSPVLGYANAYILNSLATVLATNTPYAWDIVISSPDGGSGVSRVARLVQFANRGSTFGSDDDPSAPWPFDEELPPRDELEGGGLLAPANNNIGGESGDEDVPRIEDGGPLATETETESND